jgi:hypothetical protein
LDIDVQDEIPIIIDANGDGKCDIPIGLFGCTIKNVGDNHFGYVGFEKNGVLIDDGAMNIVVYNWRNPY